MAVLPPDPALAQFIKPTLDTPFHIDFDWWVKQGLDVNIKLISHLCPSTGKPSPGSRWAIPSIGSTGRPARCARSTDCNT
jgi:hypothetical protein